MTADLRYLRRALAELDDEVVSFGGSRGRRVGRLVHSLAIGADVSDSDLVATIAGDQHIATMARGPTMMPTGKGRSAGFLTAYGVALHKFEAQPYAFSTALLAQSVADLARDPAVDSIIISFDSPGGQVTGTPEAADAIYAARAKKPVIAHVDSLAASAGYWLASQATQIVSIPSGEVGSIGVFCMHVDLSAAMEQAGVKVSYIANSQSPHKVEGNQFQPLSAEARAFQQQQVDAAGRQFISAVARGRGIAAGDVQNTFGGGRTVKASDARRAGMIDDVANFETAVGLASRGNRQAASFALSDHTSARRRRLDLLRLS